MLLLGYSFVWIQLNSFIFHCECVRVTFDCVALTAQLLIRPHLLGCVRFWSSVRFLEWPVNVRLLGTHPGIFALPCSITGFVFLYVYEYYLVSFNFGRKSDLYLLDFLKFSSVASPLRFWAYLGVCSYLLICAHFCSCADFCLYGFIGLSGFICERLTVWFRS